MTNQAKPGHRGPGEDTALPRPPPLHCHSGAPLLLQMLNLKRKHMEESGHRTQMEGPAETNNILISWLKETHNQAGGVSVAARE
ncbi:hypothetical protein Q5P01_018740 [Channa striata]|uniref:Uncharacterized protein n=1 Tax=Channa striata TaxID=64152 RepID=A0AA88M5G5_CHASR|nr:hypothetical protein Q5P01_018740 [Channa striata]